VAVADYLSRPTSKGSPKSRLTSFAVIPLRPLCRRLLSCVALLRLSCLLLFATTRAEASLCCRCCLAFQCYHDCRADGVPSQEFLKRLDDDMSGVADTKIAVLGKPSTRLRARESSSQINYDVPLIAVVLEMLFAELTRALARVGTCKGATLLVLMLLLLLLSSAACSNTQRRVSHGTDSRRRS
jgi:hypothetical protein